MNVIGIKEIGLKMLNVSFSAQGKVFKIVLSIVMLFAPIKLYILGVFAMLTIDTITGIWAAVVQGGRSAFKSKMLWNGMRTKLFAYLLLLTMALFLDKQLLSVLNTSTYYLTFFLSLLISFYESSSIVENLIKVNPEYAFLKRFTAIVDSLINKQAKQIEDKLGLKDDKTKETAQAEGEVK